ncbi:Peroxisome biogenesis protein 19-1, partial [Lachnellula arida]
SIPAPSEEIGISDEDFAKQLQAGMAELLGGLENSSEMPDMAALENIMKELGGASALGEAAESSPGSASGAASTSKAPSSSSAAGKQKEKDKAAAAATEKSFQETIKETMERMKASDTQSTAAAATATDSSDDLVAEMLKAMQASGEGEGSEEDFSKMLLGMMEQLTNKDILYEPMKELDDKFPAWMERNEGKVDEADMKRYREQRGFVREIVGRFERVGYTDANAGDREYIVERMQKMQAAGSPPPDLVGDMEAAQEAFGAPEEGCPQQ